MREKTVRRAVLHYLRTEQPDSYVIPIVAGPYSQRGAPDLVVCARVPKCARGVPLYIETKAPDGVQSPIQKAVQAMITKAGGVYLLVNNVRIVKAWFEENSHA